MWARTGPRGLPGKVKGLAADLTHPAQFFLRQRQVAAGRAGKFALLAQQIKEVGDRLQRIIDLVGDGGRKPTDGDELLVLAQQHRGPIQFLLRAALRNSGLANLERAGQGRGQAFHFSRLQYFGGSVAQNANGLALGHAAAGQDDGDRRLRGSGPVENFAQLQIGQTFGSGHDQIGGAAPQLFQKLAAILRKINDQTQACLMGRRAHSMVRQRGATQHQDPGDRILQSCPHHAAPPEPLAIGAAS